jgi:ribonuclease R
MSAKSNKLSKTSILDFLNQNSGRGITARTLSKKFRIKKRDYRKFISILEELEEEGAIQRRGKRYFVIPLYKTVQGAFDSTALANNYSFGYVLTEKGDIKVYSEDTLDALDGDIVEVAILKTRFGQPIGKVLRVIERANKQIVGNTYIYHGKLYVIPDNPKIDSDIKIVAAPDYLRREPYKSQKVVVDVTDFGERAKDIPIRGRIIEVLGDTDDPKIDFLSVVRQYELPEQFPADVLEAVKDLPEEVLPEERSRREDFTNLLTFTIDPATAKDFDDALSFEVFDTGYRLYVHIADVSYYVQKASPTFEEAVARGRSIYLHPDVIPMLPKKLSNNLCSLEPDKDRLALSVIVDYDKNFGVRNHRVVPSIIRSDARLTYEQVDRLFGGEDDHSIKQEVAHVLQNMRPLAAYLTKERHARGGLDFDLPDSEFIFDEDGSPVDIVREISTESHLLVEEFMLVANQFIAELLSRKANASIFRIHEPPDPVKIAEFAKLAKVYNYSLDFKHKDINLAIAEFLDSIKNENHHRVFDYLLLRSMMKAKYSYRNVGHFGLSIKSYTHFTSPIRRFPDLVVHHQIKQFVFHWTSERFKLEEIKAFAERSTEQEIVSLNAERTLGKLRKNRFMARNIGKTFQGIIVNFNKKNIFVELDRYPIEGFIPIASLTDDYYQFDDRSYTMMGSRRKRRFYLAQQVTVCVKRVEVGIEFALVE